MSREPVLGVNVVSYLKDKLSKYDIDLSYMFQMTQDDCNATLNTADIPPALRGIVNGSQASRRHPLKHHHPEN